MKLKDIYLLGRKAMTNLYSILKSRDITNKGPSSQSYGFSSSHICMWEFDSKESWALKNWCFWTVVFEKTLESLLDCKEIQPVHLNSNQSWMFIGRTDAEAETPALWPPDVNNWLIGKDPDAGMDWGWEEEMTEDKMVEWHYRCDVPEFGEALGIGEDREARCAVLHGVAKSRTWRGDSTELNWTVSLTFRLCFFLY